MYQASWPASCSCWASWEPQCPCEEGQRLWLHHSAAGLPEHRRRTWAWGESSACISTDQLTSATIHFGCENYLKQQTEHKVAEIDRFINFESKAWKKKSIQNISVFYFCFSHLSASQLNQEWSSYPYRDPCPAELWLPVRLEDMNLTAQPPKTFPHVLRPRVGVRLPHLHQPRLALLGQTTQSTSPCLPLACLFSILLKQTFVSCLATGSVKS